VKVWCCLAFSEMFYAKAIKTLFKEKLLILQFKKNDKTPIQTKFWFSLMSSQEKTWGSMLKNVQRKNSSLKPL